MVSEQRLKDPNELLMAEENTSTMAYYVKKNLSEKMYESFITISPFPSNILKLDYENFLLWKAQILPILHGYKLDKFVLVDEP